MCLNVVVTVDGGAKTAPQTPPFYLEKCIVSDDGEDRSITIEEGRNAKSFNASN